MKWCPWNINTRPGPQCPLGVRCLWWRWGTGSFTQQYPAVGRACLEVPLWMCPELHAGMFQGWHQIFWVPSSWLLLSLSLFCFLPVLSVWKASLSFCFPCSQERRNLGTCGICHPGDISLWYSSGEPGGGSIQGGCSVPNPAREGTEAHIHLGRNPSST